MTGVIRQNVPLLAIAYGFAAVAVFLVNVSVGRSLGAAAVGDFALAVAVSRIFYAAFDFGLGAHLTRVVSRDHSLAATFAPMFLTLRAFTLPLGMVVTLSIGAVLGDSHVAVFAIVAFTQGLVTLQSLYESLFLAHERAASVAGLTIVASACVALSSGIAVVAEVDLVGFAICYAIAGVVATCAWGYRAARSLAVRTHPRIEIARLRGELRRSWPLGASVFLVMAALRSPLVVLGGFESSTHVGAFAVVDMCIVAASIIQTSITGATYPRLAASYGVDPLRFRRTLWGSNAALAAIGVAVAIGLALFGSPILGVIFPGRDFEQIKALIPILAWSTPCLFLVHHNIFVFAAMNGERISVRLMAMWLAFILGFQLALVPGYGVVGGAWALLLGRLAGLAVLAVVLLVRMRRRDPR